MIYVDDGAFAFENRRELETGANLVFTHFAHFGLQMHIGSSSKPYKTECVFFPAPGHFKLPTLPSPDLPPDSLWKIFFNIPTIRNQIAKRELTFIRKVVWNSKDQITTELLTAWSDHKRKRGGVLQK